MTAMFFPLLEPERRVMAESAGQAFLRMFPTDFTRPMVRLFVLGEDRLLGGVMMPVGPTTTLIVYDVRTMDPVHWYGISPKERQAVLISADPVRVRQAEKDASKACGFEGEASLVRLISSTDTVS